MSKTQLQWNTNSEGNFCGHVRAMNNMQQQQPQLYISNQDEQTQEDPTWLMIFIKEKWYLSSCCFPWIGTVHTVVLLVSPISCPYAVSSPIWTYHIHRWTWRFACTAAAEDPHDLKLPLSLTDTTFNLLKNLKIKKLERRNTTPVWSIKPGLLWICGSDQTPPLCNCIWFLQHHSQHRATTPTNTVRILSFSLSVFLFS